MQEESNIYPLGCEPFCSPLPAQWDASTYTVELFPGPEMTSPVCPFCGRTMNVCNSYRTDLRAMPVGRFVECHWIVNYRRFRCPCCRRTEYDRIPFHFVGDGVSGAKVTTELARYVWQSLDGSCIKRVADLLHLRWNTVKDIELFYMRLALERAGMPRDLEYLGVDEVHIGHVGRKYHYITIVSSLKERRPIYICDGKRIEDVMPFFQLIGEEGLGKVKAVSMDANAGYATAFRNGCPNAVAVLDHFHIIQDYGRDCLGKIRIRLWHSFEATDRRLAKKFKDSLRASLSRSEDLSEKAREYLDKLRAASSEYDDAISCLYKLRQVYEEHSSTREEMEEAWDEWIAIAKATNVPEIVTFAKNKDTPQSRNSILNYAVHKISNGPIEGMNNKVGKITSQAYGLCDMDYLFTKIKFSFLPAKFKSIEREYAGDAIKKRNSRRILDPTDRVL